MDEAWPTTCSDLRRGDAPGWRRVSDYLEPLRSVLARRYPKVPEADRDDIVQDVLVDIKERLHRRYDASRGRFRAYLSGVLRNRVQRKWRGRKDDTPLEAIPDPAALTDAEVLAVDFGAQVLGALRRWQEAQLAAGPDGQRGLLVISDRLVHGSSYRDIAEHGGLSIDQVKRALSAFRLAIFADLLAHGLALSEEQRRGLAWAKLAAVARDALADPRRRAATLDAVADGEVREALRAWLVEFDLGVERLPMTSGGAELSRSLHELFAPRE